MFLGVKSWCEKKILYKTAGEIWTKSDLFDAKHKT